MQLNKIKYAVPYLLLLLLFFLFYRGLFTSQQKFSSDMIGEPLPNFNLPDLNTANARLSKDTLKGQVSLLNVWASWCYACSFEQAMLVNIHNNYHINIYGINYKDNKQEALAWLNKYGNPYTKIGNDTHGSLVVDLGVYGIPETFVINPAGEIIYRHIGVITQKNWDEVLYPLVKKYAA